MKILIVDDEPLARERLQRLVGKIEPQAECLLASSGEDAVLAVATHEPDLLLLDIRMPGMDGIEVATRVEALHQPPAIIFCTAYDEYALEALRHQAVAYLLKPIREADLSRALASAGRVNRVQLAALRDESADARTTVSSQTHRGIESLPVTAVRCFLAEQKYVTAYSADQELLLPDTLKDLEVEFPDQFVRVHRNALVSLAHIVRLAKGDEGWCVELEGVAVRPAVSRRHLAEVKARLLER
ncbi:MAG: LytTR family DNA-binding domain-containing protein [Halioglobus sp.]